MVHIKYKIWFALKLEIEDFSGDVFDVFDLVPTSRCVQNLDNGRIIVKKQPSLLLHLIEVIADGPDEDKPVYTPVETIAYKYNLVANGHRFHSLTNIDSLDPLNYQFSLSNDAANKIGAVLYANKSGDAVSAADRVYAGTFDEASGSLAVITVYQNNLVSADYRLQDPTGKCREPVFVIRFAKHA